MIMTKQIKQRLPIVKQLVETEFQSRVTKGWSVSRCYLFKWRLKRKLLGICRRCPKKVTKTNVNYCEKHSKEATQEQQKSWKIDGKCQSCRKKMNPEYDTFSRLCQLCHEIMLEKQYMKKGYLLCN